MYRRNKEIHMRHSITLGLASIALAISGCNGGGGSDSNGTSTATGTSANGSSSQKKLTIAVIPKGQTHEYWKSVHEGATTAEKELPNVQIEWKGPILENDRDSQIKVVEDFTTRGVDGMVLAPLDDAALAKPVAEAKKSNIPVVVIDSGLKGNDYISYIATDNEKGGQMDGEELGKELGGKGKVVMLRYEEGSASTDAREKGFLEAIAKFPGIQVVSSNQFGGATVETAQKASENLLTTHKKGDGLDVDGVYCPNESTTFGMLRTLEELGVAGKVKFVGFDASETLINALKKGEINALVIQNPRKMGYLGVKTLVEYIRGKKDVEAKVDTGATLVTKANLDTPDVAKLVAPPKE
jgi:ribose transport system substrate-binding protein